MRTADTLLTASQRWRLAPHSPLTGLAQPQVCCGSLPGSHVHTTLTPRAGDWTSSSSCHVLGINSQYGVTTFHSFKSFMKQSFCQIEVLHVSTHVSGMITIWVLMLYLQG